MKILRIHFWVLLIAEAVFAFAMGSEELFKSSAKQMLNTFFSAASFIPYYCYIYKRKFLYRDLWRPFIVGFFLWEIICYFTFGNTFTFNILIIVSLAPKYLAVAMYGLYMGSFRLPENKSFEEIEISILSKKFFRLIVTISILITIFFGLIAVFGILNPEIPMTNDTLP